MKRGQEWPTFKKDFGPFDSIEVTIGLAVECDIASVTLGPIPQNLIDP